MDDDQQYCLRWNNHQSTLISVFDTLLENETLVDCTLAAEGKILKAHKVVLSACSPYFATLLQEQYDKHPVFILKDVKYQELRAMMDYMYRGEVNISQDQLAALLKAAESLQIKGLSDNRAGSSAAAAAPKPEQHLRGKMGTGYTLEQTKRARMATGAMDAQDVSGSREGSSSPSRRRRKVRRRSMENDAHDNSNSSVMQAAASNQLILQQSNAASALVATQMPIAAGVSIAPGSAHTSATGVAGATQGTTQQQVQPLTTTSVNKKTDSAKGITTSISTAAAAAQQSAVQTSEVINTENVQVASGSSQCGAVIVGVEEQDVKSSGDKANHKQKLSKEATTSAGGSEMVIEPKAEYDDEGHEETVEDLTLDDEEIGMEELDQTAGTSQGGEGSSQGYAAWQHDRSQEELLLATQEAQQRDPQAKHDKSEQTDITAEEYELDDCLLESNDIVITQNKDGFVLHVKKLGNITTAKLATTDEDQAAAAAVAAVTGGHQTATITELQQVPVEVKPTLTTLTTNQAIKLPSTECELINLKKIIPASTTISTHQPHAKATIIQQHQIQPSQQHQTQIQQIPTQHQQHHHQLQQAPTHAQVQSIVTTHAGQTINMMGLRNVQIEPIVSRIKYSRGKIITPTAGGSVQIVEAHEALSHQQHHELTEGTKYEISEIDLTNPNTSAAIISDLVKYAEIDDIELPDGTKIGIGFAPTEITEHIQTTSGDAHLTTIEHEPQVTTIQHQQHEHEQPQSSSAVHQMQQQQHTQIQTHHIHHQELSESEQQPQQQHQQLHQLHEHEEGVETIIPDHITVHEQTKSYTILTTRPMKTDTSDAGGETTTTTYELSLSDSSMGAVDDPEARYVCRHCGKKYRWKSTLRRHENVECGGKEPCHPCPYCTYKAKQRGNLGVHVRKHHPDKPQLESKRGRKI